jgi:hypothetical protein
MQDAASFHGITHHRLGTEGSIEMTQGTRIEIEFDDRHYSALQSEAERLGVDVSQVVVRATSAWILEMEENEGFGLESSNASPASSR